jgi:hypothetical protein
MTQPCPNIPVAPPPSDPAAGRFAGFANISAGAGAILVLFPSAALFFGHGVLSEDPAIGLPTVAIFGILILFGALALVSTMFARLGLHCPDEALALPPGSIRAAIALALIVLFALLSVMLYHSLSKSSVTIEHLSEAAKKTLLAEPRNQVAAVIPVRCPAREKATASVASASDAAPGASQAASRSSQVAASGASGAAASSTKVNKADDDPCADGADFSYTVQLGNIPTSPAVDFAKQLLTLIGTLMTSVVSFYFAARSADASTRNAMNAVAQVVNPAPLPGTAAAKKDEGDHEHGDVKNVTHDDQLPKATGGVAPEAKGAAS